MDYSSFSEDSKRHNETNDCTVIAVSIAASVDYSTAHEWLDAAGRIRRKGLASHIYHRVLREKGFTVERITKEFTSKTVRTIERELADNWGGCRIMVNVRAHVLAWDGNKIVDWTASRQHRVQNVYLVYKGIRPKGKKVAPPEQKPKRITARPTAAIRVDCDWLGLKGAQYRSIPAFYKAHNLDLRGHQHLRRAVKEYGAYQALVVQDWEQFSVTIYLDNEKGQEVKEKWF